MADFAGQKILYELNFNKFNTPEFVEVFKEFGKNLASYSDAEKDCFVVSWKSHLKNKGNDFVNELIDYIDSDANFKNSLKEISKLVKVTTPE